MTLREIEREVREFASSFDPALLDARGAELAVAKASAIANMVATVRARAAARLAECGTYRQRGQRSPAHDLAKLTGQSVGQAVAELQNGERLAEQPDVAAAASAGQLSSQQTAAITDALAANPKASAKPLVEKARASTLAELRQECERVKAAGDTGAEARRRRIHNDRYMRRSRNGDGSESVTVRDNPERIAQLYAGIAQERQRLFNEARREGRRERSEALDADALFATVASKSTAGRGGTAAKVLVRVDFDALLRGYPIDGDVCEIAGYGPVAVSAVRDLLATGSTFLAAIIAKGEQVVGVAHLGRQPRAVQGSALEWLYPTCAREGCTHVRLERDHRYDWADTKVTLLDWMDGLCSHDHDLKTLHGWALVDGTGKRPMVPPDHPRHPKRQRTQGEEPRAG